MANLFQRIKKAIQNPLYIGIIYGADKAEQIEFRSSSKRAVIQMMKEKAKEGNREWFVYHYSNGKMRALTTGYGCNQVATFKKLKHGNTRTREVDL